MKRGKFSYHLISLFLALGILFSLASPIRAQASSRTYVVKRGDWLSKIAPNFGVSLSNLIKINQIRNPDLIFVGQRLKIPGIQNLTTPKTYITSAPSAKGFWYVIYFYQDFALHGTYWHQNFGRRMSHGCINLSIPDAKYLYQKLRIGDLVVVH